MYAYTHVHAIRGSYYLTNTCVDKAWPAIVTSTQCSCVWPTVVRWRALEMVACSEQKRKLAWSIYKKNSEQKSKTNLIKNAKNKPELKLAACL